MTGDGVDDAPATQAADINLRTAGADVLDPGHDATRAFAFLVLVVGTYAAVSVVSTALVLVPGAPLVTILVATQVLDAVLPLPLLVAMYGIARDPGVMADHVAGRWASGGSSPPASVRSP